MMIGLEIIKIVANGLEAKTLISPEKHILWEKDKIKSLKIGKKKYHRCNQISSNFQWLCGSVAIPVGIATNKASPIFRFLVSLYREMRRRPKCPAWLSAAREHKHIHYRLDYG